MKKVSNSSQQPQPMNMGDMSGMMNGMMGGLGNMMGGMNGMPPMPPVDNNPVIDVPAEEIKEVDSTQPEENLEVVTEETPLPPAVVEEEPVKERIPGPKIELKTATIMNIHTTSKNNKVVSTVKFLCRDMDNKLFVVSKSYALECKEEIEFVESLPFFTPDDAFISTKIYNSYISKYLDDYIIDDNFEFEEDFDTNTSPLVFTSVINSSTRERKNLVMNAEVFSVINFVDTYISESINNEHDLSLASVVGSKEPERPTSFFLVEDVEEIVSMASAVVRKKGLAKLKAKFKKEEDPTSIGIVLKVSRTVNGSKEIKYILTPFDIGVSFDESKFKGCTIDKIQDTYYGDSDQFVSTLFTDSTTVWLNGGDLKGSKEYMIIRGKTKDKDVRLFLFDFALKEKITKLINEY